MLPRFGLEDVMLEMILGMAVGYIAFTENGHKVGNWVADMAVREGKKLIEKSKEVENEKRNAEKHGEDHR
jgi:intein-encoded DNA endonuclease-like protein